MKLPTLHHWDLSPREALALQKQLADRVSLANALPDAIHTVAGADVSYRRQGGVFHAAVVVLDMASMDILESATASGEVSFPYVPGLLSFRELPILLQAFAQLTAPPDIILADAQGIAHPRRLGLACHLGLWLELPVIGCAKSRLCGEHAAPGEKRGSSVDLVDNGECVGKVLRTKDKVKPLIISPGHKVDLQASVDIVLRCGRGYRLPEPTRQAHLLSNQVRATHEAAGSPVISGD